MKRVLYVVSLAALTLGLLVSANAVTASGTPRPSAAKITVQLCSSGPIGVASLKDLWAGAQHGVDLAIFKYRPALNRAGVRLGPQIALDDAKSDGSSYSPDVERSNVLKCIGNKNVLAYIGTLNSGAALVGEPITNQAHLVQISPSNTNPNLTSPTPYNGAGGRASQEPDTFNHKIKWVTYYRTVTTDALQGPAGAGFAKKYLKVKSVYVVDDKLAYGAGLASNFGKQARALGLDVIGEGHIDSSSPAAEAQTAQSLAATIKSKNPDMVYCGCDAETVPALPRALRAGGYSKPFMGGDALVNTAWVTNTKQGSINNYGTSVGPPPQLASSSFRTLYKKLFPGFFKKPGPQSYDATAFDAASIALQAILKAAKAHQLKGSAKSQRTAVVKYVSSINYRGGATGNMKFDKNGDTTNRILSVYKVKGSDWGFLREVTPPKGAKPTG